MLFMALARTAHGAVRHLVTLTIFCACGSRAPDAPPQPAPADPVVDAPSVALADALVTTDAAPSTLADALATLRARGFTGAADSIARRAAQPQPKMKLTADEALAAALAVLALADREHVRALHDVMPRSTVELARAVRERNVPVADADAIAAYLVRFTAALRFERLVTFDENHSHVVGRDWPEIDYTGEPMTWQSQQRDWAPRGVTSFKRVAYIHAYFTGAERLPHWKKVYQPRGRVADVTE